MTSETSQYMQVLSGCASRDNCSAVVAMFTFQTSFVASSTCHYYGLSFDRNFYSYIFCLVNTVWFKIVLTILFYNVFDCVKSVLESIVEQSTKYYTSLLFLRFYL